MRLDVALATRGLARSRSHAAELIKDDRVQIDGRVATKAATDVSEATQIIVDTDPWVSRAAHKLLGALADTGVTVPDRVLDAGASTGGFTQVLLDAGAQRVYAVDVGHGQLARQLVADPRVVNLEGTHLRDLTLDHLEGEPVSLAVADVSFISLTHVLAPIINVLAPGAEALVLVKPQFEVGREKLGPGGVVRSPELHWEAIDAVIAEAARLGFDTAWQGESHLPGPAGNVEFFLHLVDSRHL